jgi:NAD-dependent dihydropyrimidine dehydrogenase PreA subunit
MIVLAKEEDCCGCNACVQACPRKCIDMHEDHEGFFYPHIEQHICIDCGLCEKVCPVINQGQSRQPLAVFAAKNPNEKVRLLSSSGGIFSLLSEYVLEKKGVVFGARFDDKWQVVHDYTEIKEGLSAFRGSKYVQSYIGNSYWQVKQFLEQGRLVLFSGTPCQVVGLKKYLFKDYKNLLALDFICHGVPSPKVWQIYLDEKVASESKKKTLFANHLCDKKNISHIFFRDKCSGWKKFSFALTLNLANACEMKKQIRLTDNISENIYMKGFLNDLYLRPSCYNCPSKCGKSGSDITLGDFWGIQKILPYYDDDKGVSAVLIYNSEFLKIVKEIILENSHRVTYQEVFVGNSPLEKSPYLHPNRGYFFSLLEEYGVSISINKVLRKGRCNRLIHQVINKMKNLIWKQLRKK